MEFLEMQLGSVALVLAETIFGKRAQNSRINASRVTFAITLAAAILRLRQSPSMIAVCGSGNGKTGNPSIKTCSGEIVRPATAMRIA